MSFRGPMLVAVCLVALDASRFGCGQEAVKV